MFMDLRHHRISAENEQAADQLSRAIESYLDRKVDTRKYLQAALELDPFCTLAHALQGLMIAGLRNVSLLEHAHQSLRQAQMRLADATTREQGYVLALKHNLAGKPEEAVRCYKQILDQHPTDLLALTLAQGELFWLGEMPQAETLSSKVAPRWSDEVAGYPSFLAIRSFDLEEVGSFKQAEVAGRESVERQPENVWGAHAVAHVLLMQRRVDEGLSWLNDLSEHWAHANQLKFHLWWHQCIFHLEQQNHVAALAIHDQWLRNPNQPLTQAMPDFYLDLQNGASLLWRLEAAGVEVGDRWLEMAEAIVPRFQDMTSPFTSAHIAMILQGAGLDVEYEQLIMCMQQYVAENDNALSQGYENALAAATACRQHRVGDHAGVLQSLMPRRDSLFSMGGSHAQQEIFFQMMFSSARKLGRDKDMSLLRQDLERQGFLELNQRIAYRQVSAKGAN